MNKNFYNTAKNESFDINISIFLNFSKHNDFELFSLLESDTDVFIDNAQYSYLFYKFKVCIEKCINSLIEYGIKMNFEIRGIMIERFILNEIYSYYHTNEYFRKAKLFYELLCFVQDAIYDNSSIKISPYCV